MHLRALLFLPLILDLADAELPPRLASPGGQESPPPALSARVMVMGSTTAAPYPLATGRPLARDEQVALRVSVGQPAYVYVVRYSFGGESTLLSGQEHQQLAASVELKVAVPRPVLRQDTHLTAQQLIIVASSDPLRPALCPLLHLPCPFGRFETGVRGNEAAPDKKDHTAEPGKKKDDNKDNKKDDPARPREEKRRETRGPTSVEEAAMAVAAYQGEGGSVSVLPIVLTYE